MKRTTIVGLNRVHLFEVIKQNGVLITVTVLFIFGIFTGSMLFRYLPSIVEFSKNSFLHFFSSRNNASFFKIFIFSFLSALFYSGIIYISGTSVVGTILAPAVIFLKGFEKGAICAYLYFTYSLMGIAFNAIIIIPCSIVYIFSLILFSREATYFSLSLARLFTPKGTSISIYSEFKKYCLKFLLYLLLILISSCIDGVMSVWLIHFF